MVSDGGMTLKEELTQTSPLQEALQYSQKTITERAFALEDKWKRTPPGGLFRGQFLFAGKSITRARCRNF